jgi:hypothetical protein
MALSGLAPALVRPAVQWIVEQQHADGAWGALDGNQEETAWATCALAVASETDSALGALTRGALERGAAYLQAHLDDCQGPALWIVKSLYRPHNIARAVTLGAIARCQPFLQGSQ